MTGKELSNARKTLFTTQNKFADTYKNLGLGPMTGKTVSDYEKKSRIPKHKEKQFLSVIQHIRNNWLWEDDLIDSENPIIRGIMSNFSNNQLKEVILWADRSTDPVTGKKIPSTNFEKGLIALFYSKASILLGNEEKGRSKLKKIEDYCSEEEITMQVIYSKCNNSETKEDAKWCQLFLDATNESLYFNFKQLEEIKDKKTFLTKNNEILKSIDLLVKSIRLIEGYSLKKETKYLWNKLNLVSPKYGNDKRIANQTVFELLNVLRKDVLKNRMEIDPIISKCLEWPEIMELLGHEDIKNVTVQ